jgi:hypothetical protein
MKFCGIDLHSNNSVVVVTDETDRVPFLLFCLPPFSVEFKLRGTTRHQTNKMPPLYFSAIQDE